MKGIIKGIILLTFGLWTGGLKAQELNCVVTVVTDAKLEVSTVDREVLDQLKDVIFDFMNNTQWTKDNFKVEERINCNIQLQISKIPSPGVYEGSIQVQSSRTAFNSAYNTTVFNFKDDNISFPFSRNVALAYAPNQFRDNLTSTLAFYAYYILGMDYDTFSLKGGSTYFNEAQEIVSVAQAAGYSGWKSNESGRRNRYWLVDNTLNQLFEPLRVCMYEYHRLGLDKLYDNKAEARKAMYNALEKLSPIILARPSALNVLNFTAAKLIEIKNLYSDADQKEKTDVTNLLKKIDPANSSKYQEILN
jgi:hypothetical protein